MARETAGPNSAGHKESQEPQKQAQNGGRNHETSDWRLTSLQLALLAKPAPTFIRVSIESRNNVPHACESGKGKTINNQTHTPPSHSEDEECDSIDTLVTRSFGVNDQNQPVCGADLFSESTAHANSAAFYC